MSCTIQLEYERGNLSGANLAGRNDSGDTDDFCGGRHRG